MLSMHILGRRKTVLKVDNLKSGYDDLQIINGISIEVKDNSIVAIVGANGVGKSTLLKTIFGIIPTMEGRVTYNGEDITGLPGNNLLEKGISLIPEGRQLFNNLTVLENLKVGSITKTNKLRREENMEKMFQLFPVLAERKKQLAGTLSGGEQQMLVTARALMSNPTLLVMDEPTWGLAPILVDELFKIIEKVRDEEKTSVLLVEQNVHKSLELADWAYVFEHGKVSMEGIGKELLGKEDLKKAYLGI